MYSRLMEVTNQVQSLEKCEVAECMPAMSSKYKRDVKKDIHTGIDKYHDFLQELRELHPEAVRLVLKFVVNEINS